MRLVFVLICNQSINQFFNYRNVKTHFHMRKTQSCKIYVKSVNTYQRWWMCRSETTHSLTRPFFSKLSKRMDIPLVSCKTTSWEPS